MAQKGTMAGRILSMLVGALAAGGAGGMGGGIAGRILGGGMGGNGPAPGTSLDYPDRENTFEYVVDYVPGPPQNNAAFNGDRLPMRMQTLDQHNRALNKYIRPGQSPMERRWAIEKGKAAEKTLPEFWTNDVHPRRLNARSSSSAVSGVKILPNGDISVQFRNGDKWYTYNGGPNPYEAALVAHDLVTSPSLGRSMNRKGNPTSWAARHAKW